MKIQRKIRVEIRVVPLTVQRNCVHMSLLGENNPDPSIFIYIGKALKRNGTLDSRNMVGFFYIFGSRVMSLMLASQQGTVP